MKAEKVFDQIYSRKGTRVLMHVLFWTAVLLLQWYLAQISFNDYRGWPQERIFFNLLGGIIATTIFYYPFVYWILPNFSFKKRVLLGIGGTLGWLIVFNLTDIVREELVIKSCVLCTSSLEASGYAEFLLKPVTDRLLGKFLSLGSLIGLIFSISLPLSIKYGISFLRQQYLNLIITKENVQLELNFLRSQVNPHFLFNTMNNIYGLIMNDEKKKSLETVAGLTDFLRYSLYQSSCDQVGIGQELQLIRNYVALESIRLNHIEVIFEESNDNSVKSIAPLLLIPLIDNTFKHTEDRVGGLIKIQFQVKDKHIIFKTSNHITGTALANTTGGIGLINLQKRLNLYYPGKYVYDVDCKDQVYHVRLNIDTNA